jgi:hypothetical protein
MNGPFTQTFTMFDPDSVIKIGTERWFAAVPGTNRGFIGRSKAEALGLLLLNMAEEAKRSTKESEGGAQ